MAVLGNNQEVAQAFTRFGLGGRPDDALPPDARAWLLNQLVGPDPMPTTGLPTRAQCMALINTWLNSKPGSQESKKAQAAILATYAAEVQAFLSYAVTTQLPFRERLVWFWANHFSLLTNGFPVEALAGVFIREVIRPNINRSFSDMVLTAMQHPAMLYSLDNTTSIGPQSPFAVQHFKSTGVQLGINENLARECLELHTVGLAAGYTQADVDALAYMLTGWTVVASSPKGFTFNSKWHQPGNQTLLGNSYPPSFAGALQALTDLANNDYTYWHIATELVQHFVSDTPATSDVQAVHDALSSSGGNLQQASAAIVALADAWVPLQKFRTPQDHAIAAMRAAGLTAETVPAFNTLMTQLGQPTWGPPFPNGYSDLMSDWLCPQQIIMRADWSRAFATTLSGLDPLTIAGSSLGPFLTPLTQQLLGQLSSTTDQFELLFCSPEFQRR